MPEKCNPIIYIVDDDASVRRAMKRLIRSAGFSVKIFTSSSEFLNEQWSEHNACLIADVQMQDMSGLELQRELIARGKLLPVIFITAYDTEETRERAKKAGAAGYFRKPVDSQALLDSIFWALAKQST